jgi:hypothetical protein
VSAAAIDFSTVAVLVFVLWLDGWRRVEVGGLVVRRVGFGPWALCAPSARIGELALVAWWPPIVLPFVVASSPAAPVSVDTPTWEMDHAISVARGRRRIGRVAADIAMLRILGALLLVWIALGIPLMTARAGATGLLRGIAGAVAFSVGIAVTCFAVLRMSGMRGRSAIRMSLPLVSPFSAARAAEVVVGAALDGLSPAAQLATLLSAQRFAAWLRPWAYDEMHARHADGPVDAHARMVIAALPAPVLAGAIANIPSDGNDGASSSYCPRCGRRYYRHVAECSECADVALLPGA